MTEWFGVGVESTRRSTGEKVLVSVYLTDTYEEAAETVDSSEPDGENRLVLLRVQEVRANGRRKIDARKSEQESWEKSHPRGTNRLGEKCECHCHANPGTMHIMACCHAPYFD